ncbi:MAG: hypothetical protein HONBIEJF_01052 [Fimbriimonadaceae bacterium]|nr:hypothetical protein [Fimbriimonadaceae bacterium]
MAEVPLDSLMAGNLGRSSALTSELPHSHFKWIAAIRTAVIDERWNDVITLGYQCLGWGHSSARLIEQDIAAANYREQATGAVLQAANQVLTNVLKHENHAQIVAKLREHTPDSADKAAELFERLSNRNNGGNDPLNLASSDFSLSNGVLNWSIESTLAILSRGLLAIVHGHFNREYRRAVSDATPLLAGEIDSFIEENITRLRDAQYRLYADLGLHGPSNTAVEAAASLSRFVEGLTPSLAIVQAQARNALYILNGRNGSTGLLEKFGRVGLRAGVLTREALASHVAAYRLQIEIIRSSQSNALAHLWTESHKVPFDGSPPNGKNISLANLANSDEGQLVEVEGFVDVLRVGRTADGKLVSALQLIAPSGRANASSAAVYVHLLHRGITRRSYCKVTGTYRRKSKLLSGTGVIEVANLQLAELGQSSWRYAFLKAADEWFQFRPNGLHMEWSLGPQRGPRAPEDTAHGGAGELIYPPFVQSRGAGKPR